MIKNFIIVAQEAKTENAPTRRLTTNTRTPEDPYFVDLGVAWVKKNKKGETFLSCQLENEREYQNKEGQTIKKEGFVILTEKEYKHLKNCEARCEFLTSDGSIDMATHPLNTPEEAKRIKENLGAIGF